MSKSGIFPRRPAWEVAKALQDLLWDACERVEIVGSLRRDREFVHDIELLYVPKMNSAGDLFGAGAPSSLVEPIIAQLLSAGTLTMRKTVNYRHVWGPLNKLAVHVRSGIHVDLFATSEENWWNSLVVRTGGKKTNLRITTAARKMGWSFEAYGSGFRKVGGTEHYLTNSERDVFRFVGLPYLEPCCRA